MTILIIDDNTFFQTEIQTTLQDIQQSHHLLEKQPIVVVKDFAAAVTHDFSENDVIFLDIQLQLAITGIDIGKAIRKKNKELFIVFLTSHEHSMTVINSGIRPFAYLLKTDKHRVLSNELFHVCQAIDSEITKRQAAVNRLTLETYNSVVNKKIDDIYFIASMKGYRNSLTIKCTDETLIVQAKITALKTLLVDVPAFFFMKSLLINTTKIQAINVNAEEIIWNDQTFLSISRSSCKKLSKYLKEHSL